ncbi:hypothetical protein AFLA70_336g001441, partial [Aspergillus flavus AF70]
MDMSAVDCLIMPSVDWLSTLTVMRSGT